jgi:PAS domain S-box-containing protein
MTDDADKVRKLRRQQAAIASFGSFALHESDLAKILNEAARVCAEGLDVRYTKVCRYRPAENDLLIEAGFGWQPGVIGHVVSRADDSTPQGRAFITGEPAVCMDVRNDNAFKLPAFYAAHGIITTIDAAIKGAGKPYGVLEVDSDELLTFDAHDIDFVTAFANVLAEAVVTASRNASLRATVEQMHVVVDELGKSEERFRIVVEAAPSAIVMFNADGRIEMVNVQAERTFGYKRDELVGRKVDLLIPERHRAHAPAVRSELFTEPPVLSLEAAPALLGLHKDGHEFPIYIRSKSIEINGDSLTLATILDVTERTLLEAQLRQSQKMDALGRLTAGVAHDFNNLLQAMMGSLELLLDDVADRPESAEHGQIALRAARRGGELTHRLLAFSRQQVLTPRAMAAHELFDGVVSLIARTFGPNIVLLLSPIRDDLTVMADIAQLEAAILNLAVNARDAMDGRGRLTISAYAAEADAAMTLAPGNYAVIAVEDTGTGMDAATIAHACEPFFTTKGLEGSGLGLSMVQGFTRQSGGDMRIASELGRGTRVEIWLPQATQTEAASAIARTPKIFKGQILLVDDDNDVLLTVAAFLRNAGYLVTSVDTGGKALALLLAGNRFDAIVTDYAMPGTDGIDVLEQAREIDETMPGLIITGYYNTGLRDVLEGACILRKPFSRAQLIERLEALFAGRRAIAAASPAGHA